MMEGYGQYWNRLPAWRKQFPEKEILEWRGDWLENGYCSGCRLCCGPQGLDAPFPMALMPDQTGPENEKDFYMLDAATASLDGRGCKSSTAHGCRLPRHKRPPACGLFPFVLANGGIYLYKSCPAALFTPMVELAKMAKDAAAHLRSWDSENLRHLSLELFPSVLAEKYIDMNIQLF